MKSLAFSHIINIYDVIFGSRIS